MNKRFLLISATVWSLPLVAFAASPTLKILIERVLVLFDNLGIALIGLAAFLVAFGIMRYFSAGDDPAKLSEGTKMLMWGILALFVMVSMWGLVNLVLATFFTGSDTGGFNLKDQLFNGL